LKKLLFLIFLALVNFGYSQEIPQIQKVLFVLDASGSMEAMWGDEDKMTIAKNTLYQLVDSIERANPSIQVGLRVFGHQYHKSLDNCTDSKLEIPFGSNNQVAFANRLKGINPNGNTPIAYSLIESAKDFTDIESLNSIILITDGLENCDGNPCDAAKYLNEKRITINPFIIGLNIEDSLISSFDCIGTFINAKDQDELKVVLQNTVKQATGQTTLSIELLSVGNQTITNTPITINDAISEEVLFAYIHSLTKKGKPDTLKIDPRGWYDIKVHSYPPISSDLFQLTAGVHNTLTITIPKSYLAVGHEQQYDEQAPHFILKTEDDWVYNYRLDNLPTLANTYKLSTTLIPLKNETVKFEADQVLKQNYPANGKLSIKNNKALRGSIFDRNSAPWNLVYDIGVFSEDLELKLQPGVYSFIYINESDNDSERSHRYDFEMFPERTTVIQLR
jgi:Ca-activated chloride channel family protein